MAFTNNFFPFCLKSLTLSHVGGGGSNLVGIARNAEIPSQPPPTRPSAPSSASPISAMPAPAQTCVSFVRRLSAGAPSAQLSPYLTGDSAKLTLWTLLYHDL